MTTLAERIISLFPSPEAAVDYLLTHEVRRAPIEPAAPGAGINRDIEDMPPEGGVLIIEGEGSHRCGTIRPRGGVHVLVDERIVLVRAVNPLFLAEGIDQFGLDCRIDLAATNNFDTAIKLEDCFDWTIGCGTEIRNSGTENKEWTQHGVLARGGERGCIPRIRTQGCQIKIGGSTGGVQDFYLGQLFATRPMQYALSIVVRGPHEISGVCVDLVDVTDPICAGRSVFLGYDEISADPASVMRAVNIGEILVRGSLGVGAGTSGNVVNVRPCAITDAVWIGLVDVDGARIEPQTTRYAVWIGDRADSTAPTKTADLSIEDIRITRVDRSVLIRGDVGGRIGNVYGRQTRAVSVPPTITIEGMDIE